MDIEVGTDSIDRDLTGNFTGFVAAHAIGDNKDTVDGDEIVFVLRTYLASVGGRSPVELGHYWASITVVPTWMRSPGCKSLAPTTLLPLWNVPLVEPRSSSIGWPS